MPKCAVITGGTRGIGAAVALSLAKEGYNIAITYNTSSNRAQEVVNRAMTFGVEAFSCKSDVKDYELTHKFINSVVNRFGDIDVLVNNAAISSSSLFTDLTNDEWNDIISTNLSSCYNFCHAVLPHMIKKHSGSIINISSMWGQIGASCEVAYSASKAGVIGLTKALAKEVSLSRIRVNAIAPGVIKTDMLNGYSTDDLEILRKNTPLQRLGTPEDIANAVVFLASEKASFITGQILGINGGFVI